MVDLKELIRINRYEWEIPKSHRPDMRVPVRIFATKQLLDEIKGDKSLEQAVNAATLPGLVSPVVVMPDVHQGYGFPIGGVAATRLPDGIISPGAIGYDINCGVRLLASQVEYDSVKNYLPDLANSLNRLCPSGVGKKGHLKLSIKELDQVCINGSRWALKHGYASDADVRRTEETAALTESTRPRLALARKNAAANRWAHWVLEIISLKLMSLIKFSTNQQHKRWD